MSDSLHPEKFTVVREEGVWVATHVETGIASQGDDPNEAVAMAEEAVALGREDHEPAPADDQDALRRELELDVDENERPIDSPSGMP